MTIPLVDLKTQHCALGPEIQAAIGRVLERSDFILGREVEEFEAAFAHYIGARHCVGVASGTDALSLALRGLGIGTGDKVLVPANTFIATALAVTHTGAAPVLVDMDPASCTIDVARARRALTAGVKAIIPVHLYGQPADMDGVLDLAHEKGLLVLEDCAQAHGAVHRAGRCGSLGHAAAFSFYPGKNLGALGDGGGICTDDGELAERLRRLRNFGGTVKYHHPEQGFNSRLDTLQAAVLSLKLRHLDDWSRRRRQVAAWYREELEPLTGELELPSEMPWTIAHVYHLFVIRTRRADRDAVLRALHAAGIVASIHYPVPIHLQRAYANLDLGLGSFPAAESAARCILSLPLYPEMSREQVDEVARALHEALATASATR
jgi:dTDP-4-amino-4,6-dideoxygalactose transaminase